jgi:general secretion pathway protein J
MIAGCDHARSAGFSLVEMLVSLVVVGLAAVLLAAGIGRIGLSINQANRGDSHIDTIATAQFTLRQRLAGIQPVFDPQAGATIIDFAGLDTRVDFIADPADHDAPDALHYYRIARDPDGDLMLFSINTLDQRADVHNPATVGWTAHPLVQGTAAIEIRYLGRSSFAPGQGLVWQDNWTHRGQLPQLVRVRVSFPQGDPRSWPDLIVHPRAAVPDACPPEATPDTCPRVTAATA